ncbi:MAG: hypothetical protein JRD89_20090 [Deltaproteobacteria bacterium]|nr:hypothetical protein [Deltaproteobacteria bacterium]
MDSALLSVLLSEDVENIIRDLWEAWTRGYVNLFGGQEGFFWLFLMSVTVIAVYIKTESVGPALATLIVMGALLPGLVAGQGYFLLIATGVALALVLYLIYRR